MLSRSAALQTSAVRAAAPRATPARIARRWESSSSSSSSPAPHSTAKPAEDYSIGISKPNASAMIAGAFGLCFAGVWAFMMGSPEKAQDVAGKVSSEAQSKEQKFRRPTSTS